MRFKSPTSRPVSLKVDNVNVTVGPEYQELDSNFHKEALAVGCLAEPEAVQAGPQDVDLARKPKAKKAKQVSKSKKKSKKK